MADNEQQAPGPERPPSTAQVENVLGSFDFDAPPPQQEAPVQAPPEAPAGEAPVQEQPVDDDPEISLRDNTRVKLSELKRGYLPNWQTEVQKWQQHAQEVQRRQQALQQQSAGFNQYQQQAAGMLQQAVQLVEQHMPRKPDVALAESDPFAYQTQRAHYEAAQEKLQQARYNRDVYVARAREQQKQQYDRYIASQAQATLQRFPDLRDPVKFAKWTEEAKQAAVSLGYMPDDLRYVRDHKTVALINEVIENRRNKAIAESAKAKLKAQQAAPPPPVQQPRRRRTSSQVASDSLKAAMTRLQKNPSSSQAAEDVLSKFD